MGTSQVSIVTATAPAKIPTILSRRDTNFTVIIGNSVDIIFQLHDEGGIGIRGKTVSTRLTAPDGAQYIGDNVTDTNGFTTETVMQQFFEMHGEGDYQVWVEFAGDETYEGCEEGKDGGVGVFEW